MEHKETCFKINVKQNVELKKSSIKFKSHFKQLAVTFKIYADFESVLKIVRGSDRNNNTWYTEKYQEHITCSFAYNVVYVDDEFGKPVAPPEKKMLFIDLLKQFLKSMIIVKSW